jgi:hypothetical protein
MEAVFVMLHHSAVFVMPHHGMGAGTQGEVIVLECVPTVSQVSPWL